MTASLGPLLEGDSNRAIDPGWSWLIGVRTSSHVVRTLALRLGSATPPRADRSPSPLGQTCHSRQLSAEECVSEDEEERYPIVWKNGTQPRGKVVV